MKPSSALSDCEAAFRKLYPDLAGDQLKQAAANFVRYLEIAWEICQEQKLETIPSVDSPDATRIITEERSKCSLEIEQ